MRERPWTHHQTPYEVLEVAPGASAEDIGSAYKVMSQIWHPDKQKAGTAAHDKATSHSALLNEARDLLLDPRRRAAFDRAAAPQGQRLPPNDLKGRGSAWKALAAFLKDEDLGSSFLRQMAYKMGDALERGRDLTEKQRPYAEQAWDLGVTNGFVPNEF